jgi:LmbE family N-acetylglucosaminyl deacetylase
MTAARALHESWCRLRVGQLTDIIGAGPCIVLAPHPDDESLGCGGLIATCAADGRPASVVILTDGAGSHPRSASYPPERLRALRRQEAITAVSELGLTSGHIHFLNQPDTAAPTEGPEFASAVEAVLHIATAGSATAILAPWRHDPHCDHEAAALLAERVAVLSGIRLVSYPVWGWALSPATDINEPPGSGWRLDVSDYLPAKRRAIGAHRSQYGGLITDDPAGFQLSPELLAVFDRPYETYLSS